MKKIRDNTIKKTKKTKKTTVSANLEPEIYEWLETFKYSKKKCNIVSLAITFYHEYIFYKKGFLLRMIQNNFEMCKYLLRKLGRILKNEKMSCL